MHRALLIGLCLLAACNDSSGKLEPTDAGPEPIDATPVDGGADALDAGQAWDGGVLQDSGPECVPTGPEVCNGRDDDCDGEVDNGASDTERYYRDSDRDGFGDEAMSIDGCTMPAGFVSSAGDCNDRDPRVGVLQDDDREPNDTLEQANLLDYERLSLRVCTARDRSINQEFFELPPPPTPGALRYLRLDRANANISMTVQDLDDSGATVGTGNLVGDAPFLGSVLRENVRYVRVSRWVSTNEPCHCAEYTLEIGQQVLW